MEVHRAGLVERFNATLPRWRDGFDSRIPLQISLEKFVQPYPALAGEGGLLLTPSYNLSILALVVSERLLFSYNSSVRMIVYPWKVRFVPL